MINEDDVKQHIAATLLNYPGEPNIWVSGVDSKGNTYEYQKVINEQHNVEFIINDGPVQQGKMGRSSSGQPRMETP